MARKPVSVFKRPMSKKGQYRYYIQLWDEATGTYGIHRSAESVARELGLDPAKCHHTSRTGAFLIGQELLARKHTLPRKTEMLYADYCEEFWDWDRSQYIQGKLARGQRIGREYVTHCAAYVR